MPGPDPGRAFAHAGVEVGARERKDARIEADVIARQQPSVAIERGVLHRLGTQRRAQLLKAAKRNVL